MNYPFKLLFFLTLIISTLITISSSNWISIWIGLEINLLSFIPLMIEQNNSKSTESSMKYFLIQAFASSTFIISILIIMIQSNMNFEMNMYKISLMIPNLSMIMKMGAAPLHFWFPEVMSGMNWTNSLILMTWQKIAPMISFSYMLNYNSLIIMLIMMSSIIGSISGLNQLNMKKLMAFSSINHMSWMLSTFLIDNINWIMYFIVYFIISSSIIICFKILNLNFLKQLYSINKINMKNKIIITMNFLSLGGLPPFLGFFPKWIIIQSLSLKFQIISWIMISMTLITLFFYIRISLPMLITEQKKILKLKNNNKFTNFMMSLSFISMTSMSILTLMSFLT